MALAILVITAISPTIKDSVMYPHIALASASPRRRELLQQLGVTFELISASIDERVLPDERPDGYVSRLALAKAQLGWQRIDGRLPVLGADTSVVIDNRILGKPVDKADFVQMMVRLAGRKHQVITAVALVTAERSWQCLVTTEVYFRAITDVEIQDYWQSGEPCDKAGGYGIQGLAGKFVERINGSYSAVVGLPLCETDQLLKQLAR